MTVVAVRTRPAPSVTVTVAPPKPFTTPLGSVVETTPLRVATPVRRCRFAVPLPPAARVTSRASVLVPSADAETT